MKIKKYILFLSILFISFFSFTNSSNAYDSTFTEEMGQKMSDTYTFPVAYTYNVDEVYVLGIPTTGGHYESFINTPDKTHKILYGIIGANYSIRMYHYINDDGISLSSDCKVFYFKNGSFVDWQYGGDYFESFINYKDNFVNLTDHFFSPVVNYNTGEEFEDFFPMPPQEVAHQIVTVEQMEEVKAITVEQITKVLIIALGLLALLIGLKVLPRVFRTFSAR